MHEYRQSLNIFLTLHLIDWVKYKTTYILEETMTTEKIKLNFDELPIIECSDIFIRFPPKSEKLFSLYPELSETHERANAALNFFCHCNKIHTNMSDAYIRAGLNEFFCMEEALSRDLKKLPINITTINITNSRNPLLHYMRLLRNVNIHLIPMKTNKKEIAVTSTLGGESHEYTYHAAVLDKIKISDLSNSHSFKKYNIQDITAIINWTYENQFIFGVSEILRRGLFIYCEYIFIQLNKSTHK